MRHCVKANRAHLVSVVASPNLLSIISVKLTFCQAGAPLFSQSHCELPQAVFIYRYSKASRTVEKNQIAGDARHDEKIFH